MVTLVVGALYVLLAVLVGLCGRHRRVGFLGFLLMAVLITPPLALLLLYLTKEAAAPRPSSDHGLRGSR